MKRTLTLIGLLLLFCGNIAAQNVKGAISDYLNTFTREDAFISPSTLKSCIVNDDARTISVTCGGGFEEQYFTEEAVERIYREMRAVLPSKYRHYRLRIVTDNHEISELIPNATRKGKKDEARLWQEENKARPWVVNLSRPYTAPNGLEGTHISLWQSHGRYYDIKRGEWRWQRPRLFCTCEDLFSQTFVVPYIIPMLENAGAVVYTPRERDWQSHEVIVDNDAPNTRGQYSEQAQSGNGKHAWRHAGRGFAQLKQIYTAVDSPFYDGTSRCIETVLSSKHATYARWMPDIPVQGRYAVYVSYLTVAGSVDDARYKVYHKGGITEFSVNQQMGGNTWVYLGTFEFDKGQHDYGMVTLTNESKHEGFVTADAVRFGGGMGNISRNYPSIDGGTTSGLPRWAEAARYATQWAGMSDSICNYFQCEDDYKSDILSRPMTTNWLSGGSTYVPNMPGVGVPFDLALAFHTDAGVSKTDDYVGSLSVCTTNFMEGLTDAGVDRYTSRDLASMFLANLYTDLSAYHWQVRKLWNRNYGETRVPRMPAAIVEMLSHQNFTDMKRGYDPKFKFDFCRSLYKTIVKYEAEMHQRDYVIQPLPVHDFAVTLDEKHNAAILTWQPTADPLESTARPTHYIVYTRQENGDFDNGQIIHDNSCSVTLSTDRIYSFRICAVNKGGRSFPSETLSACISSRNEGTILIVNGFTRLSGPQVIDNESVQGFDLDTDPGVPYGAFAGFCGRQTGFDKANIGSEASDGLGASGSELEGTIVMGNTFDYAYLHGQGIQKMGNHSFASCSQSAFLKANTEGKNHALQLSRYKMLDIYFGTQKYFEPTLAAVIDNYCRQGGRVFVSGANLFKNRGLGCTQLKTRFENIVTDKSIDDVYGSGVSFKIYRKMNADSYSVPQPEILSALPGAFAMLAYSDGTGAAIAYSGKDYRTITFGFPLESIRTNQTRNQLMGAVVRFLCQ